MAVVNFCYFIFILFSLSFSSFILGSNIKQSFINIENLKYSDKKMAINLIELFNETVNAQNDFYSHFNTTQKMFEEIKEDNKISARFLQLKAKGPVEENTIWRALYDTQLRRSPSTAKVNVFSEENVEKEYENAKYDSYESKIAEMKKDFERNLKFMKEEIQNERNIKHILHKTSLIEQEIKELQKNKITYKKQIPIKKESTKVVC